LSLNESSIFSFRVLPTLQKTATIVAFTLGLLSFVFALSGCRSEERPKVAEVDGLPVLMADFEKAAGKELFRQREALYRLEQQKLYDHVGALLLTKEAKKRGISVETLLDQEVIAKVPAIGDDEIEAFYKSNKSRLPVNLDKVREQIREYLRNQKIEAQKALYLKSLRSRAKIKTYLKPPMPFRAELSIVGEPTKGPERAPVSIIKFEDFQCPFCKQVQPTVVELLKQYDGKLRLVHKDLPLDSLHGQARQAAEAGRCADEQGKFWTYHDTLYAKSPKASVEDLKSYAKDVGLNVDSFDRCFTSGKYKGLVQKNLSEGAQLGLTGTPTFFINGRELSGAQPLEAFAAIIEEELAQAR
jgi:protein-disulfide isomerase